VAYCSDYSNIAPTLAALRRVQAAVLDGSGWKTSFPSHQPMAQVIPIVKRLKNLKWIFFTHNGHLHVPHAELNRRVKQEGDRRFAIAYHSLRIRVQAR
jgi:transglutaminase/protease-like cytokinesis protein 3